MLTRVCNVALLTLVLIAVLSVSLGAYGQATDHHAGSAGQTKRPGNTPANPETHNPRLEQNSNADLQPKIVAAQSSVHTSTWTELGQPITVSVKGLNGWSKQKGNDVRSLRLYLAGQMLPKQQPSLISLSQEYVNFILRPDMSDSEDRRRWTLILQEARRQYEGSIPISVGPSSSLQPFDSEGFIRLQVYPRYTPLVVGLLVALFLALIALGYRSELLRDTTGDKPDPPARSPLSLGRVQMAWWFYLVIAAYLYLWLVTEQTNMVTPSVLALIGISAGTGLAAVFVDQQKQTDAATKRTALVIQQSSLQSRIADLVAASPIAGSALDTELQDKKTKLGEVNATLTTLPPPPAPAISHGFLDLLRDGDGVSFHRFQIVVWTIVFGIVFVRAVLMTLTMPEFDSTLLGLMGLSSGTYVGFKFPEKPK